MTIAATIATGGHRLSIRTTCEGVSGRCSCEAKFRAGDRRSLARKQIRRAHEDHVADVDHAADLQVDCGTCEVGQGIPCRGIPRGRVHGARRIRRLLAGIPLAGRPPRRTREVWR